MYIGIHTTFHVTFLEVLKPCCFSASLSRSLMQAKSFRLITVPGFGPVLKAP